jgi:hypothetical protein
MGRNGIFVLWEKYLQMYDVNKNVEQEQDIITN